MSLSAGSGRRCVAIVLGTLLVVASVSCAPAPDEPVSIEAARAELRDLITDVPAATAYRYKLTDDQGRRMGPTEIVWVPEADRFAAVYFTWDDADARFHLHLATSEDLLAWTWERELADLASQPSIAAMSDGGYVVAWEQEPDPIHIVIASFASWDDLRSGTIERRFDVPITTPACGEGTPSIESASDAGVALGFHYHSDCRRDRQASGFMDWTTWRAEARPERDEALSRLGVDGHIGDRDTISFRGHDLMLLEGQRVPDDWSTWRMHLYDDETRQAEELAIRTHAGSVSFANPTVSQVEIGGHEAILVTLYLFTEGSQGGEDEELLFYRNLPDGS